MTEPAAELGPAGERAARKLADLFRRHVPPSLLADPDTLARAYWREEIADGWRYRPPLPGPAPAARSGTGVPSSAHAAELAAARARCEQATAARAEAARKDHRA